MNARAPDRIMRITPGWPTIEMFVLDLVIASLWFLPAVRGLRISARQRGCAGADRTDGSHERLQCRLPILVVGGQLGAAQLILLQRGSDRVSRRTAPVSLLGSELRRQRDRPRSACPDLLRRADRRGKWAPGRGLTTTRV